MAADAAHSMGWTADAYFAMERDATERHVLWRGEIFAMAGGSEAHNLIGLNVGGFLREALRAGPCRVYSPDQKIHVPFGAGYVYPDVSVRCDSPRFDPDHPDVLLNPQILVEVLSDGTERFDRGEKAEGYRALPSVTDYLLISQHVRHVEHFARQTDGSWLLREYRGTASVVIPSIGVVMPLDEVYLKVAGVDGGSV